MMIPQQLRNDVTGRPWTLRKLTAWYVREVAKESKGMTDLASRLGIGRATAYRYCADLGINFKKIDPAQRRR